MILKVFDHDIGRDWAQSSEQLAKQLLAGSETYTVSNSLWKAQPTYSAGLGGSLTRARAACPTSSRYKANLISELCSCLGAYLSRTTEASCPRPSKELVLRLTGRPSMKSTVTLTRELSTKPCVSQVARTGRAPHNERRAVLEHRGKVVCNRSKIVIPLHVSGYRCRRSRRNL